MAPWISAYNTHELKRKQPEMNILVTGGGGFIGRNLVKRLLKDGHEVTVTSTGSEPVAGVKKVLYMSMMGLDWDYIYQTKFDVVFHQMANNDTRCMDEKEMNLANFDGPEKLFNIAFWSGCRRFVYASSTAVYGNAPAPYTEDTPIKPLIPYARSKAMFDEFAMSFATRLQVSMVGLRYCNVYGPGEENKGKRMSMIGQIIRKMIAQDPITLFKDGSQKRDWVYVDDVVEANILASQQPVRSGQGTIYNIGSGRSWSFNDIVDYATVVLSKNGISYNIPVNYIDCPFPDEYQTHTECQIEKAKKNLAFSPKHDLRSGIEAYVKSLINAS